MKTVYEQLKPEFQEHLLKHINSYPHTILPLIEEFKSVYFITEVSLKNFIFLLTLLSKDTTYKEFQSLFNKY